MKLFEEYLPRWSNEKHLPIPTQKHMDRWMVAWADFMKDELPKYYDERRIEYLNMRLKTKEMMMAEDREKREIELNTVETVEEKKEESKPQSAWDRVKVLLFFVPDDMVPFVEPFILNILI